MGADLVAHYPAAASIFDDAGLQLGYKIDSVCFYGPIDKLAQTDLTQPALYTVSAAALKVLQEAGVTAEAAAGHSVGEYAALLSAGVFDFETGLRLVNSRGLAMSRAASATAGTMAAVLGLDGAVVAEICREATKDEYDFVVPANYNGAGQVVISGTAGAVEAASAAAKERGAKRVIPLSVSGGFHSPLMKNAAHEMKAYLDGTHLEDASIPVVANVTAAFEQNAGEIASNLVAQIDGPVRWEESVKRLLDQSFDFFIEIGSGSVLTGLMKRISKDVRAFSVSDRPSLEAVVAALKS